MTTDYQNEHNKNIITQFTQQAIPFTKLPGHLDAIKMLIKRSNVSSSDNVLDVACGPGLVACEFAKRANKVTGIDITQKMIEQARLQQDKLGLSNIEWNIGTAYPLPYSSDSFSVVITRYSFHHFLTPSKILSEMIRVCKPEGTVLIADAALPKDKIEAYNRLEKLRDPSHTQALSFDKWEELLINSGLKEITRSSYRVEVELESQLEVSFPNLGDKEKIREIFRNDINSDSLGMQTHLKKGKIYFSYPISIFVGYK